MALFLGLSVEPGVEFWLTLGLGMEIWLIPGLGLDFRPTLGHGVELPQAGGVFRQADAAFVTLLEEMRRGRLSPLRTSSGRRTTPSSSSSSAPSSAPRWCFERAPRARSSSGERTELR